MIVIDFERLPHAEDLPLPTYATDGSSGMDICAAVECDVTLDPGQRVIVPTGFKMAILSGYEAQVRSRSGLAAKYGVTVLNSPGTIDSDYRGEVKVILMNHGTESFVITRGDRIAQLVISSVVKVVAVECAELSETARGEGGLGSTGHTVNDVYDFPRATFTDQMNSFEGNN